MPVMAPSTVKSIVATGILFFICVSIIYPTKKYTIIGVIRLNAVWVISTPYILFIAAYVLRSFHKLSNDVILII